MYFADLTAYTYDRNPEPVGLNVGWLDGVHEFTTGKVPAALVERLIEICKTPVVRHRGFHECELCDLGSVDKIEEFQKAKAAGAVSSTVIQVTGRDGRIYFSPAMICHYIAKHGYKPPEDFIRAVLETDLPNCLVPLEQVKGSSR